MYFLFVKQKTAYEMRISDWSSDVGSSDLCAADRIVEVGAKEARVEPHAVMLTLDLIEQSRGHCGEATELIRARCQQLDRNDVTCAVLGPRQPFENFSGTPVAVDCSRRFRAIDDAEDMGGVQKPARGIGRAHV